MYIRQSSVKQRLGSIEGGFGFFGQVLPTTNFKVTAGYTLKQNGTYYYLLNSKGQQTSSQFTVDQIKSAGGIKDYQGKIGLTYYPTAASPAPRPAPAPSTGGSVFNLNLGPAGCQASKASTCDISGQCYDRSGCPITQEESQRLYATPSRTPAPTAPVSTGPSAGEVLTGVGSILSALATPAAGFLQTYTEAKTAKAALKQQSQQQPYYTGSQQPTIIQQGPSTGLILGIVGGFAVMAVVLILVLKKK